MEDDKFVWKNLIHGGDRNYYVPIILSFVLILYGPVLTLSGFPYFSASLGALVWLIFYALRFRKKDHKNIMDILKFGCTLFLGLAVFENTFNHAYGSFLVFLSTSTLFTIYFIDRIILKVTGKLFIVLTIIIILESVFFVVYANTQTNLAIEQVAQANQLAKETEVLTERAEQEAINARQAEANAEMALEELRKCQESN